MICIRGRSDVKFHIPDDSDPHAQADTYANTCSKLSGDSDANICDIFK